MSTFLKYSSVLLLLLFTLTTNVSGKTVIDTFLLPKQSIKSPSPTPNYNRTKYTYTVNVDRLPIVYYRAKGKKKVCFKNITKVLQAAVIKVIYKGGGVINIPKGNYIIDTTIMMDPYYIHRAPGLISLNGNGSIIAPKFRSPRARICFFGKTMYKPLNQEIRIANLTIDGKYFLGDSKKNFQEQKAYSSIRIINFTRVHIHNCRILNMYGQAITVLSDDGKRYTDSSVIFKMIEVYNNFIYNSWGQNFVKRGRSFDNYGDGILVSNAKKGAIFNNIVYNDLYETGQYGRLGIGAEYQSGNMNIVNNRIHGYDRDIHIEISRGGFNISHNKCTGTESGILIWPFSKHLSHSNPITVSNNYISNWGLPLNFKSRRVMSKYSGMIHFFQNSKIHEGSVIKNNTIKIDKNYAYQLNKSRNPTGAILPIKCDQDAVSIVNNIIKVTKKTGIAPKILVSGTKSKVFGNKLNGKLIHAKSR